MPKAHDIPEYFNSHAAYQTNCFTVFFSIFSTDEEKITFMNRYYKAILAQPNAEIILKRVLEFYPPIYSRMLMELRDNFKDNPELLLETVSSFQKLIQETPELNEETVISKLIGSTKEITGPLMRHSFFAEAPLDTAARQEGVPHKVRQ